MKNEISHEIHHKIHDQDCRKKNEIFVVRITQLTEAENPSQSV